MEIHHVESIVPFLDLHLLHHKQTSVSLHPNVRMYISPFFPRPGTPAATYDYVYGDNDRVEVDRIKKARVREMTDLFASFEPHSRRLNTRQFWLCDKGLARDGIHFIGLNGFAEKILVRPPKMEATGEVVDLTGKILEVDVFECGKKYMYATVCEELSVSLSFRLGK